MGTDIIDLVFILAFCVVGMLIIFVLTSQEKEIEKLHSEVEKIKQKAFKEGYR